MTSGPGCIEEVAMIHKENLPWVWERCSDEYAVTAGLM